MTVFYVVPLILPMILLFNLVFRVFQSVSYLSFRPSSPDSTFILRSSSNILSLGGLHRYSLRSQPQIHFSSDPSRDHFVSPSIGAFITWKGASEVYSL